MNNAVLEYIEGYFGGELNESTTDDNIMEAFNELLETADAVEEYLNELKVPTSRMSFTNVPKKKALRSFVHGVRNPNKVRKSDLSGLASRGHGLDDSPYASRPGDFAQSGAELSRTNPKPTRKQKRKEFARIAGQPLARGTVDVVTTGLTKLSDVAQAFKNRRMRKKRPSLARDIRQFTTGRK